ncbi:ead/Ea22-like family protein [Klebsiella pneumoniae]|uniref:ead/Ea22-like family protein n=1 Tax=Klebsiella pneumoniae TaxID=573 RepID=UPI001FF35858|nr:ead/Ea22-like family protein [Klebsiella pneumoniae]MCK1148228.1 ead/Ea22-like family protein [Klebsiella pneumoniae]
MKDITELAQSLKAAAEKATPGRIGDRIDGSGSIKYECFGYDGSLVLRTDHKNMDYGFIGDNALADEEFFRACVPDAILALVEALEKAQTKADVYDMLRDDYGLREKGVGLADFVDWQAKRIAELESRTVTVKLPKPHAHLIWIQAGHAPDDYWDDVAVSHSEKDRCCDGSERYPVYARWEIEEMLTAAGIKVEAE